MPRYKITTPDTARVPGRLYADFECAQECATLQHAAELLKPHDYEGCTVHRFNSAGRHWTLLMDTTGSFLARLPGVVLWNNVLLDWG